MTDFFAAIVAVLIMLGVALFVLAVIVSGLNSIRKSIWEIRNVRITRHMSGRERREAWRNGGRLPHVDE